jgi:hypothetical protein
VHAFERRVVAALADTSDPASLASIEAWVDASLADMPEVLRLGVRAESLLAAVLTRLRRGSLDEALAWMARSPVGLLRQYVRLFRSLVLFAKLEGVPDDLRDGPATEPPGGGAKAAACVAGERRDSVPPGGGAKAAACVAGERR